MRPSIPLNDYREELTNSFIPESLDNLGDYSYVFKGCMVIRKFIRKRVCILSTILFHRNFSDQIQMVISMKNPEIGGDFTVLIIHGAENYSIDSGQTVKEN